MWVLMCMTQFITYCSSSSSASSLTWSGLGATKKRQMRGASLMVGTLRVGSFSLTSSLNFSSM